MPVLLSFTSFVEHRMELTQIPELQAFSSPEKLIRIPSETDVPVTTRVLSLIDTQPFRKLAKISQLGLVSLVYPGATHTRFEHSLGTYRNALLYLSRLVGNVDFCDRVDCKSIETFLVAVLLHDIGHYPFCHPIEDMRIKQMPRHESQASSVIIQGEVADILHRDWEVDPQDVCEILAPKQKSNPKFPLLSSILSGPIDVDKLDYLDRDSLHAGVPYGRYFDRNRLIGHLTLSDDKASLAITDKARTAAEMMVFARYIMFSEVYWHSTVRGATAMFQRAFWDLFHADETTASLAPIDSDEFHFIDAFRTRATGTACEAIVEGLFGSHRRLYKCVAEFHYHEHRSVHQLLSQKHYSELVEISRMLAEKIGVALGRLLPSQSVLIDAPPAKLEVQFQIQIKQSNGRFLTLGDLSPVTQALTTQQFDNLVKRVRIFVAPEIRDEVEALPVRDFLFELCQ